MPVEFRGLDDTADLDGQGLRHPFVGVDLQHPVTSAGFDAGVAALALLGPIALDQAADETGRNFLRVIGALVEQHDNLVGEREAFQAVGDLMALIADADDGGKRPHARDSRAFLHNSRAAPSALSTSRLPMSESEF